MEIQTINEFASFEKGGFYSVTTVPKGAVTQDGSDAHRTKVENLAIFYAI